MNNNENRTGILQNFAQNLGLQFNNPELLQIALTHPSFGHEKKQKHNQRLEFLGDAVLDVVISDYLFHMDDLDEGQLTKIRANFVQEKSLAYYAKKIGIGEVLLLGRGAEKDKDRLRPAVLADALEALIGAIYKDRGLMAVKDFVIRQMGSELDKALQNHEVKENYKTLLQEDIQKTQMLNVLYKVIGRRGPQHQPIFTVAVYIDGKESGTGEGKSRREAEQAAAKMAYKARLKK